MHLAIARQALAQLGLSQIHWMVSGFAPHKPCIASPADRLAMVQCVLTQENDPRMIVNDFEVKASIQGGPNYAIDTLRELRAAHPDDRLVLIIGGDQANQFESWKDWQSILGIADLAVVGRPGFDASVLTAKCESFGARLTQLEITPDTISATNIRAAFCAAEVSPEGISDGVALYVRKNGLYEAKTRSVNPEPKP